MVKQNSYISALYEMHTRVNPYINGELYIYIYIGGIKKYNCDTHSITTLHGNAELLHTYMKSIHIIYIDILLKNNIYTNRLEAHKYF